MRSPAPLLTALLLGFVHAAALPATASACTVIATHLSARDTPANGVVIIRSQCSSYPCFSGALPSELSVIDVESGQDVPGAILRSAGALEASAVIAWRPAQPLIVGRTYEVTWRPDEVANEESVDLQFEALAPSSWTADDIVIVPSIQMDSATGDSVTCESDAIDMCFGNPYDPVIALSRHTFVGVVVQVDVDASPQDIQDLFALRAAFWRGGDAQPALEEVSWENTYWAERRFDQSAQEYCYQVEITSLVDSSVAEHEGCLPHGELGETSSSAVTEADLEASLRLCTVAPPGLGRPWCAAWRAQCVDRGGQGETCATLEATCAARGNEELPSPSEPEPTPIEAIDPVDPIDPNEHGVPADSVDPEPVPDSNDTNPPSEQPEPQMMTEDATNTTTVSACSAGPRAHRHGSVGALALLGLALAFGAYRRAR